jgi:hypothetical protein
LAPATPHSQQSSTAVEAKHDIAVALWVITARTAIRPVHDMLTVSEHIREPHPLDRMGDKASGGIGGKPARDHGIDTPV